MRQTTLQLTDPDRQTLTAFRSKGIHPARSVNRAHILSALDQGISEKEIMWVLGIGRTALWRTRAAYVEQGLLYALEDAPRPGQPLKYPAKPAAEVSALACTPPPAGAKRWTLKLLTQAAQSRPGLQGVSRETIRRILKKTFFALGRK
jgi:transposase